MTALHRTIAERVQRSGVSYQPARPNITFTNSQAAAKLNFAQPADIPCWRRSAVLNCGFDRGVERASARRRNSSCTTTICVDNPACHRPSAPAHSLCAHAPEPAMWRTRDSNCPINRDVLATSASCRATTIASSSAVFREPRLRGEFAGADHGLHTAYNLHHLPHDRPIQARGLHQALRILERDRRPVALRHLFQPRCPAAPVHTRYGRTLQADPAIANVMFRWRSSSKGTLLLDQGEELGLPDGPIARERPIRDPRRRALYPYSKGRDSLPHTTALACCRTKSRLQTAVSLAPRFAPAPRALSSRCARRRSASALAFRAASPSPTQETSGPYGATSRCQRNDQLLLIERTL